MTKLLRVTGKIRGGTLVAGGVWERGEDGQWQQKGMCAPSLYWMKGLSPAKTMACLHANGWKWEWLEDWPLLP